MNIYINREYDQENLSLLIPTLREGGRVGWKEGTILSGQKRIIQDNSR